MMLKFRPIAPKPTAIVSLSRKSPPESTDQASSKTSHGNNNRKKKASLSTQKHSSVDSVVTLPLLRETPGLNESPARTKNNFGTLDVEHVSAVVTLECVAATWLYMNGFGFSNPETVLRLSSDKRPAFISNGSYRVIWSNKAYNEMVGGNGGKVIVWLVMQERVPITCSAFSCRVRVQSTLPMLKGAMIMPCDVWRLNGGGLAWRLDVDVTLSLGR